MSIGQNMTLQLTKMSVYLVWYPTNTTPVITLSCPNLEGVENG